MSKGLDQLEILRLTGLQGGTCRSRQSCALGVAALPKSGFESAGIELSQESDPTQGSGRVNMITVSLSDDGSRHVRHRLQSVRTSDQA